MIVAWSAGGVVGPLVAARLYESSGGYTLPFTVLGVVALVSLALPMLARPPRLLLPVAAEGAVSAPPRSGGPAGP
jgi:hypothetical protein